jgi:hypothetical protein
LIEAHHVAYGEKVPGKAGAQEECNFGQRVNAGKLKRTAALGRK